MSICITITENAIIKARTICCSSLPRTLHLLTVAPTSSVNSAQVVYSSSINVQLDSLTLRERWVGSARRELFDHVIPLNEYHLRRLGRAYVAYYNCASHCPTFLCV